MSSTVLSDDSSIRWSVYVPESPRWVNSPSFHVGGTEYHLNCSESRNRMVYLNLCPVDKAWPCGSFDFRVDVEAGRSGRDLQSLCIVEEDWEPRGDRSFIWKQHTGYIEQVDRKFRWNRLITFVVYFDEWPTVAGVNKWFQNLPPSPEPQVNPPFWRDPLTFPFTQTQKTISTRDVSVQTSSDSNPKLCLESLLEDFAKMLEEEDSNPDVELHCSNHTIKAHKAVLTVRSPVLASMLKSNMVEGRTGIVKIQDMDLGTFQRFIRYLYTGKLDELTFDEAMHLYEAGDMYEVKSLATRCSRFLAENLTLENVCDALVIADAHSDSSFVDAAMDFALEKKVPLSGQGWKAFRDSHPKLACEVLARMCELLSK